MPTITIIDRAGQEREIVATNGLTVMEIVRDNGFDELLALCGGCCSCATCHVFIDDAAVGRLSEMTEDENDLLDSSAHRQANSRLSCQLPVTDDLDGLRITIAPED